MQDRSYMAKVGYIPHPVVLKFFATDQKTLTSALLIFKAITHGNLAQLSQAHDTVSSNQDNTFKILQTASKLDPYNMDSYYLAQAMAWDNKKVSQICELLMYGMQYRTWDFYLPFFAGFNYSYFLKDYPKASENYKRAAEITGSPLFSRLAGRYLYEGGQTTMAIIYLKTMLKSTSNPDIKKSYTMRLDALQEVQRIENGINAFVAQEGREPSDITILLTRGFLLTPPVDPYGGTFYLDKTGKPRTTSKLATPSLKKE